jgi:hypothetical protein
LSVLLWLAVPLVIGLAWFTPRLGNSWLGPLEAMASRFATKKGTVLVTSGLAVIALRLALLPVLPVPTPVCHDEFSYLLIGDTFAHGRLTNPPHPMWLFLDTFHVLQHPTYASIFPPAHGATLALGQIVGHPWAGVLLSMALMTVAITWMLQGWLPARWALLGMVLVILRSDIFSYWMESYWGGAVAATAGALVLGALPRIIKRHRTRDACWMALGAGLLVNSRPYEGLLFCLPVSVVILGWLFSHRSPALRITGPALLLPMIFILGTSLAFVAYYNWRVIGNAFLIPHSLYGHEYINYRVFVWDKLGPPLKYANPQFEAYFNGWLRGPHQWDAETKFLGFWQFFLGPVLTIPFVTLPWLIRDRRTRLLVFQLLFCIFGSLLVAVSLLPHHIAPLAATTFVLLVQAMRHLRRWEIKARPIGVFLTRLVVILVFARIGFYIVRPPAMVEAFGPASAHMVQQLEALPNKQLVIVGYSNTHNPHVEWVYNAADIDHSKIVWAREIPGVELKPLLEYFRDRTVWLLEPDRVPIRLQPYPPAVSEKPPAPGS